MPPVILVGSGSRAAAAIAGALTDRRVVGVRRRAGRSGDIVAHDYQPAPQVAIPNGAIVVNCVGTPHGGRDELLRVNAAIPIGWAEAAKAAGALHYVQLSSFSVYGGASRIGAGTEERPADDYGRAKLSADRALLALASQEFVVTVIRLPMLFGDGEGDRLTTLVGALKRLHMVPIPADPVERSMLSYQALGVLARTILDRRCGGVIHAAHPVAFSYPFLLDLFRRAGRTTMPVRIPSSFLAMLHGAAPRLSGRLFRSSLLDPQSNFAADLGLPNDIETAVSALLGKRDSNG